MSSIYRLLSLSGIWCNTSWQFFPSIWSNLSSLWTISDHWFPDNVYVATSIGIAHRICFEMQQRLTLWYIYTIPSLSPLLLFYPYPVYFDWVLQISYIMNGDCLSVGGNPPPATEDDSFSEAGTNGIWIINCMEQLE